MSSARVHNWIERDDGAPYHSYWKFCANRGCGMSKHYAKHAKREECYGEDTTAPTRVEMAEEIERLKAEATTHEDELAQMRSTVRYAEGTAMQALAQQDAFREALNKIAHVPSGLYRTYIQFVDEVKGIARAAIEGTP